MPDGTIPGAPSFATVTTTTATPVSIPGGPSFDGHPQPPDVPCDPTGEDWRGPPGPPGATYVLPVASTVTLGGVRIDGTTITIDGSGVISSAAVGGVSSFNTRVGAITLLSSDVTTALGYTPYDAVNPAGYQTAANVTATLVPYALTSSLPVASSTTPLVEGGAGAVGVGTTYARADHVHPAAPAGASVVVSDTPPASPNPGDMWFDSVNAQLFLRYQDADSSQWVVANTATPGAGGPFLALAGGTLTGPLILAADPTTSPQAANKHYVDNAINLAGNYLGTWSVAANSPSISAGGSISNANYVATTVVPATPEVVPVGVPGIAGLTVANGDRVIWAAGLGTWQILRNAGVTLAAADARYVALAGSTMTGALTLPGNAGSALQAVPLQQVPVASSTTPAMDGTATIGAGTTWARADHIHPTDTTRASVASVAAGAAAAANNAGRNRLHNPRFSINQRGYVSGTARAAGAYAHDRWKAGAAGCTYTFTQSQPGTTITITAGSLQQIVEAMAVEGGTYTLSWTGTAQGRVNAGAYAASPVTAAGLAVNTAITVEFNAGTLAGVQLEIGSVATPLEKPDPQQDLAKCQRFYQTVYFHYEGYSGLAALGYGTAMLFPVPMRAAPAVVPTFVTQTNCGGSYVGATNTAYNPATAVTAAGAFVLDGTFTASADL